MLAWLILLFVCVPLVEFVLLFQVGARIGLTATVGLVVATGVLGAWLARRQGFQTVMRIQHALAAGQLPAQALLDAGMILIAGALLITPGILTDVLGFSLLTPVCRKFYRSLLARSFRGRFEVRGFSNFTPHPPEDRDEVIDTYVVGPSSRTDDADRS